MGRGRRGGTKKRSRAGKRWWGKLTEQERYQVKQKQRAPGEVQHHYLPDAACPPCGTDATVGCIAVRPGG